MIATLSARLTCRTIQQLRCNRHLANVKHIHRHFPHDIHNRRCFTIETVTARRMATARKGIQPQQFDYFLVLDFEATCEKNHTIKPQAYQRELPVFQSVAHTCMEIIEFPVLKVNGKTFETEAVFHHYVMPRVNRELSPFCTELTGIIQDMVDGQPHIEDTLQTFNDWMAAERLLDPNVKSIFVTCGDWDLKVMLPSQSQYFDIRYPMYLKKWINIKKAFSDVMSRSPKDMMEMLRSLVLPHEGRHHSGIDDCKNIAKILKGLAEKSYVFRQTGSLC